MSHLMKNKLLEMEHKHSMFNTNLYELIEAVVSSTRFDEDHLTGLIVSHILSSGNVHISKGLAEKIRHM